MELHLSNPELVAKVDRWVIETGRSADELIEDAMVSYLGELTQVRKMLDGRYEELKRGDVPLIDGDEAFARLMERTELQRKASA